MDVSVVFKKSYARVMRQGSQRFLDVFYQKFMDKSSQIQLTFHNTDMNRQKEMLEDSLIYMVEFASTMKPNDYMISLVKAHRKLELKSQFFDFWIDAMIEALYDVDTEFDKVDEIAWRVILSPGLQYMKYATRE